MSTGGLFALGASTQDDENTKTYMDIGKNITNTCHESYIRTNTRLGPEAFRFVPPAIPSEKCIESRFLIVFVTFVLGPCRFSEGAEAKALRSQEKYYILRPETYESYFILWRLTHDQKYRDWGWDAIQAIERYCRSPGGFSGIKNVYVDNPQKDDVQQSFFIAESLKVCVPNNSRIYRRSFILRNLL